ncbi:MAG: hypothetical protein WD768_19305 [Phycisphaeraceae bacterium]
MIENRRQLENTRKKVESMEALYARMVARPLPHDLARELTLQSLRKRINQFKEEMIRFEAAVRA